MPFNPMPAAGLGLLWPDEPGCPACAAGWHARCRRAELADDPERGGELVERCCDGLLVARRRRPWWAR